MQLAFTTPNKIESPSRVFAGYGNMIGAGLLIGLTGMTDQVSAAVTDLVPSPQIEARACLESS
jgi:hypothetical protein